MPVQYLKTLKLSLEGTDLECQLSQAVLNGDANEGQETLVSFCEATDIPGVGKWVLSIGGWQDWQDADGVMSIIHTAFKNGQDTSATTSDLIDYVLEVGGQTRTGQARPLADAPFGGDAGAALTFTADLACTGAPTDGTAP